jgi:hypothetical protein
MDRIVALISGVQASGKSTIAHALAARLEGVVVEGDDMGGVRGDGEPEELARLRETRYRKGASACDAAFDAGRSVVHCDSVWGDAFVQYPKWLESRPLLRVMLVPSINAVVERVRLRGFGYDYWRKKGLSLEEGVRDFTSSVLATPRVGLWIDSSRQTPQDTVDEIITKMPPFLERRLDAPLKNEPHGVSDV